MILEHRRVWSWHSQGKNWSRHVANKASSLNVQCVANMVKCFDMKETRLRDKFNMLLKGERIIKSDSEKFDVSSKRNY